jgi:hypothetical protein
MTKQKIIIQLMAIAAATIAIGESVMAEGLSLKEKRWSQTQQVWNGLRADKLNILDDYYDTSIKFEDPLGAISGLKALKEYYAHMYKSVEEIKFDFDDVMNDENQQFVTWTMSLKAKNFGGGKVIKTKGASIIKFSPVSGKVIYHRDYFDSGEFIYENVPGLRLLHKFIKSQLHP